MAGLDSTTPVPTGITLHRKSRVLEIVFNNGRTFSLPFEFLRVYSPSAEVRGHGPGQEVLQVGKRDVDMLGLEPVGNYAVKPTFSDGHDSGLYSWDYLYMLGERQEALWRDYLQQLEAAGASRDPALAPPPQPTGGCASHRH
ncbi:MAG: gamma-butyrobetaine hydroxylase-like domain-containing protein [Rhodocyclaceae bacterium]